MSDFIHPGSYPILSVAALEVLPVLSAKLQYVEIPSTAPPMSQDEKIQFLDIILKCFKHEVNNHETRFQITFLTDDSSAASIRAINSGFSWVRSSMYSLLALLNFVQVSSPQPPQPVLELPLKILGMS